MTFSIVAGAGTAYGVAVASKFLASGYGRPGRGPGGRRGGDEAFAKVSYKADSLALLGAGASAAEAVARITAADPLRETRQVGVVAADGAATFTGADCSVWAGGVSGGNETDGWYAVQGNILVGPQVVDQMERAWLASAGLPLQRRLLAALLAGDAAGGDRRGRQSAALYVVERNAGYDGNGIVVDLRVDEHPAPASELARLLDLNDLYFGSPQDVQPLNGALGAEVSDRLRRLGHIGEVQAALTEWAGIEKPRCD